MVKLIDISVPIVESPYPLPPRAAPPDPHWPYEPADLATRIRLMITRNAPGSEGRIARRISAPVHMGTHVDAPDHFKEGGVTIDKFPIEMFFGETWIADMRDKAPGKAITPTDLDKAVGEAEKLERLILRADWFKKRGTKEFLTQAPYLTEDAAKWCVKKGIKILGCDFVPDKHGEPLTVHKILLGGGVCLLTNLTNLDQITKKRVTLAAFPIRLIGTEAAPVRAVVIEE